MKKAIVVDDTKNIRNLLTTCLEINGYEVVTATNGIDAIELFQNNEYDLAFLDIKMPEISGTEVLRRIRAEGVTTPVVIMTAYATVKNAVECTKLGAVAYLQKPFTADKVKSTLEELQLDKNPDNLLGDYILTGKDLIESGRLDDAYEYLKKSLSIDPSNGEVYHLIGRVHELNGNIEEAKRFYSIAKQFE